MPAVPVRGRTGPLGAARKDTPVTLDALITALTEQRRRLNGSAQVEVRIPGDDAAGIPDTYATVQQVGGWPAEPHEDAGPLVMLTCSN